LSVIEITLLRAWKSWGLYTSQRSLVPLSYISWWQFGFSDFNINAVVVC